MADQAESKLAFLPLNLGTSLTEFTNSPSAVAEAAAGIMHYSDIVVFADEQMRKRVLATTYIHIVSLRTQQ